MRRRTVVAGVVGTLPLLSGCSDPGTTLGLAPEEPRAVGTDDESEPSWSVAFDLAYELNGLEEDDGLYGVASHLIAADGDRLERIGHGDLSWRDLPSDRRETGEYEDGVEYYRGTVRERVSATTDRFPQWIAFTVDRVAGSGVWKDASIEGVTAAGPFEQAGDAVRDRGSANVTENRTDSATNRSDAAESTVEIDRGKREVDDADWERIDLNDYRTYPPSDEIPAPTDGTENETANET